MRLPLVSSLVFVLASCPIWCATFEGLLSSSHAHGVGHLGGGGDPATPAPVNDDHCICNGGLAAAPADLTIDQSASALVPSPFDLAPLPILEIVLRPPDATDVMQPPPVPRGHCALIVTLRC